MYLGRPSTCARPATRRTIRNSPENAADETLCLRRRDRHDILAAHQLAKRHGVSSPSWRRSIARPACRGTI